MKIKDTLNLGKTSFPMRAGLPKKEPELQKKWIDEKLYFARQKINEGKPSFILHDGPPYANGDIHIGHALNKIPKDFIIRYKSMTGFRAPYIPGWDTHGLPIEQQLFKKGVDRKKIPKVDYLKELKKYALEQVNRQRIGFKRLGILGDWDNPYLTLDHMYEAQEIRVFGKMAEKGYIYRGAKPIYWSWSSESSLAEAEIEYYDIKSPSLYVALQARDTKGLLPTDTEFVIWTTTAWTFPSNRGIFVNPNYDYVVVQVAERKFLVAKDLLADISEKIGWEEPEVLQTVKGFELEYMTASHPFYDRDSLVMVGDYVTLDSGTGLVHSSPNHGEDDYQYSRKYNLPVIEDLNGQGIFNEEAPGFEGKFYDDVEELVLEKLRETNRLLFVEHFTHSYPHDWRTKKPVIYRALPQWFVSIKNFKKEILLEIEKVNWINPWGEKRLYNMIKDRGDWVISRQRAWGVPLPIFYAENGKPIITAETIDHVANLFEKYGSSIWFEREPEELLPDGFSSPDSPNGKFFKENDIMDVWFDSGSSWNGVLNTRAELSYPADLYLEGSDQYRGWFNSSIISSVAVNGISPYKSVLSQGFVLDGKGRKMSKSLGNVISPDDVAKLYGVDILRLWVASVDAQSDVRVSMDLLAQISEMYKKIRNTLRFLISNTSDFNPNIDAVDFNNLQDVDRFIVVKFNEIVKSIKESYEIYDFMGIYKQILNFLINDLSAFYLDFAKDIIYIEPTKSNQRLSMQTAMYRILVDLTKLLVPIIPHTAEEVWGYLTHEKEEFAYLSEMPTVKEYDCTKNLLSRWTAFLKFRDKVLKALEKSREAKVIGKSLEARVTIYPNKDILEMIELIGEKNIAKLLIVSNFIVSNEKITGETIKFEDFSILVVHESGNVCERCRRTDETVGTLKNKNLDFLCMHCAEIVQNEFPEVLIEGFDDEKIL